MTRIFVLALLLAGCSSLPKKPTPPHRYFEHPDQFATVGGLKVRYKETGTGEPLLLVHGLQTSSYSWRYNLDSLGKSRRVIALDLIGSGLSAHPDDWGYTPEHMADFLDEFRAALGIDAWDVVGNSLGGAYAATYAARHPSRVRKLVVIHAPAFMKKAPFYGLEQMRRGRVPEFVAGCVLGPWVVRRYQRYHRPGVLSEEEVEQFSLSFRDREGRRAFVHVVEDGMGEGVAERLEPALTTIQTPTLLIWATDDTLIPPWTAHRWERAIPNARLVWVPESSHFPHVEAPETTERYILEFLQEQ